MGVADAVKKTGKKAIISFGASYLVNMDLKTVVYIVNEAAKKADADVALHLDHCKDLDIIKNAIDAGFTSVMYDGSALDFEENVKNTQTVCKMAHETDIDHGQAYTDPAKAKEFVERTGVDALAVSIGTVHGMYKAKPNIRIDILEKIAKEVSIPLVLHGGSGTPEETILKCIENGICKINVNTEISQYTVGKIAAKIAEEPNTHLSKLTLLTEEYVSEIVEKYIKLFARV